MKSKSTCSAARLAAKARVKLAIAVMVLIVLATALTIPPPAAQATIALGFIAFWVAGAIATGSFLLYSHRQDSQLA